MMKHQDWLSNRGYQQHINVLTKIITRHSSNPRHLNVSQVTLAPALPEESPQRQESPPRQESPRRLVFPVRSRDNLTMREQQILWDNYHLGKRIIETPPVISKRRLDQDYRKHQRLVQCLTASTSRKVMPTDFRVKKLQEYKENVEHLGDDRAIVIATQKLFIRLQIHSLTFYRQRPFLDQLLLTCTHYTKVGRKKKQKTENFPANELAQRHFYFSLPKRFFTRDQPLVIEIEQFKGLVQLSVGYFSFPSKESPHQVAQIFHCGKPIGEVVIQTLHGKKQLP